MIPTINKQFRLGLIFGLLACMIGFYGCIDENLDNNDPGRNNLSILTILLAGEKTPQTYGITKTEENRVDEIDLLVFKKNSGNETFLYHSPGSNIADVSSSIINKKTFQVQLANTDENDQVRLVVVANASSAIIAANLQAGEEKEAVLKRIRFNAGKWPAENPGSFNAFPMWGESANLLQITSDTHSFEPIKMLRAVARVDVGVHFTNINNDPDGLSNFKLKEVFVYNSKSQGQVAPYAANITDNKATAPSMPSPAPGINSILSYGSGDIDPDQKALLQTIYLAESPAGSAAQRANAPSLIIGGSYNGGSTTYYRMDFLQTVSSSQSYLPILRNHRYVFNITQVDGPGYLTKEEAFAGASFNNIQVNTIYYDEAISSITFDGNYMLGLSDKEIRLKYQSYNDVNVIAFTDYPQGWKASIDNIQYPWVRITSGTSGAANVNGTIHLETDLTNVDRVAEMVVTCGRLRDTVRIYQLNEADMNAGIIIPPFSEGAQDSVVISDLSTITLDVPNLNMIWGMPNSGYNAGKGSSGYLYTINARITSGFPPGITGSFVITPDDSWLNVNIFSSYSNACSFYISANAVSYPECLNDQYKRTGTVSVRYLNLEQKIKVTQGIPYYIIPKGFVYRDQNNNQYTLPHTLMITTAFKKPGLTWQNYANVPDAYIGLDPDNNQVSPARSGSCAELGQNNYAGKNGWRLPAFSELQAMNRYALENSTFGDNFNKTLMSFSVYGHYYISKTVVYYSNNYYFKTIVPRTWFMYDIQLGTYTLDGGYEVRCIREAPELD